MASPGLRHHEALVRPWAPIGSFQWRRPHQRLSPRPADDAAMPGERAHAESARPSPTRSLTAGEAARSTDSRTPRPPRPMRRGVAATDTRLTVVGGDGPRTRRTEEPVAVGWDLVPVQTGRDADADPLHGGAGATATAERRPSAPTTGELTLPLRLVRLAGDACGGRADLGERGHRDAGSAPTAIASTRLASSTVRRARIDTVRRLTAKTTSSPAKRNVVCRMGASAATMPSRGPSDAGGAPHQASVREWRACRRHGGAVEHDDAARRGRAAWRWPPAAGADDGDVVGGRATSGLLVHWCRVGADARLVWAGG
jgi:hypothetical protein